MEDKFKKAVKKSKAKIIIVAILWVIFTIVFVAPLTMGIVDATSADGNFSLNTCIKVFTKWISNPFGALGASFTHFGTFIKTLLGFTLVYIIAMVVGLMKAMPKSEYTDIEYGSSDWCENGEQYRILSPKAGIILSEKNYLPLDKRGNTNVLVIRRFWSW